MRVKATATAARWLLEGFLDAEDNVETDEAEVFSGIGSYSRPPSNTRPEAVILKIGGESGHPTIVATRDHDLLKAFLEAEGDEDDVHAIFNSVSFVRVKKDGTVEAGSIGGTRKRLATKDDLDAVVAWATAHLHADPSSGFTGPPVKDPSGDPDPAPSPTGTQKLEAE